MDSNWRFPLALGGCFLAIYTPLFITALYAPDNGCYARKSDCDSDWGADSCKPHFDPNVTACQYLGPRFSGFHYLRNPQTRSSEKYIHMMSYNQLKSDAASIRRGGFGTTGTRYHFRGYS